jgi:hypothetical protein
MGWGWEVVCLEAGEELCWGWWGRVHFLSAKYDGRLMVERMGVLRIEKPL